MEVKQKTGLTKFNLDVNTEIISAEVAQSFTAETIENEEKATSEFNSYLESTAQSRATEMDRTKTYLKERRSIARTKIIEKNSNFITSANINNESIIFQSEYAPLIIVELTKSEIINLSKRIDVEGIALYIEKPMVNLTDANVDSTENYSLSNWRDSTMITKTRNSFDVSGDSVTIGIVERYNVTNSDDQSAK